MMMNLQSPSPWRPNLAQQFMIGSLVVLAVGMFGIGAWVARQIEDGVVQRTGATTALYVNSLVASSLQDLESQSTLSEEAENRLRWLFADTPLGQEVALFQVWDRDGRVVFSTAPALVGQQFPVDDELATALTGRVSASIGEVEGGDRLAADVAQDDMLEIYSPVRGRETGEVIAVVEFYYATDELRQNINEAQRRSWLVVGLATLLIYLILSAFVRRASDTIDRQRHALTEQVAALTELLRQNEELHQRARGAAARTVALNERFLRRFSAELHDGPAQDISLALLRLDNVAAHHADNGASDDGIDREIGLIQASLRRALQDLRSTSSGILLPQLNSLSVAGAVDHVVRGHKRRTPGDVEVIVRGVPDQAPLATKIALYRIIQEALANASRHAAGAPVNVVVEGRDGHLRVEVADEGPGFDPSANGPAEERLGLAGMRERVESMGGSFVIESAPGKGSRVRAELPLSGDGLHE